DDLVVDFSNHNMSVLTSASTSIKIDIDGARGNIISASGQLHVNAFNFFDVSGILAFEKYDTEVSLSDGTKRNVELLSLGGSNLNVFAGLNGGTSEKMGLSMTGADFALATYQNKLDATESWTSLKATAATASFVGLPGMTVSASNLLLEVNMADSSGLVIDHLTQETELKISNDKTMSLDMDGSKGEILVIAGDLDINISNFFTVKGGFALTKSSDKLTLSDDSEIDVDVLTLGANDVEAFAGINGGTSDAIGFQLKNVDLGIAMIGEKTGAKRSWYGVKVEDGSASFEGIDGFEVSASNTNVEIASSVDGVVIDYSTKSVEVKTSNTQKITIDFDGDQGELIRISADLKINLFNFFTVEGGFAFSKSVETVTLSDNNTATVDLLTLGGNQVSAFVGMNAGTADQFGFELSGLNFGLALMTDQNDKDRSWTSVYASATSSDFIDTDILKITSSDLLLEINMKDDSGLVVDFKKQNLKVNTSSSTFVTMKSDGSLGELIKLSGQLNIRVSDFFTVSGGFAFQKFSGEVKLSDNSTKAVDFMTIGANGVDAFAGLNGGTSKEFGLKLGGVNFALVIATDQEDSSNSWTSLKANASSVSLVGIDGLTVAATSVDVAINIANSNDVVVDYKSKKLTVATSSSTDIELDLDGSKNEMIQVSGNLDLNIFDFFTVKGGFAFEKSSQVVILADGSEAEVNLLTLGGSNVSAFAGIKGGTSDQIGFALTGVSFGLALMSDKNRDDRSWLSLQGTVGTAAFEGIDGLTLAASNMVINVNHYTGDVNATTDDITTETTTEVVTTENSTTTTTVDKKNTQLKLD
ncbi:hypothetical protein MJH12_06985, partial [bacterium]|nr:hypothetical protein [bacterium]